MNTPNTLSNLEKNFKPTVQHGMKSPGNNNYNNSYNNMQKSPQKQSFHINPKFGNEKKESYIYDLYGVCNHSGSVSGGHYTAYVKNANGKWYHFNDTSVSEVVILDSIVSPKAYVLFYRKKSF